MSLSNLSAPSLSTRQSLFLTAIAASAATTSLILSYQALRREHKTEKLKRQVGEDVEKWEREAFGDAASGSGAGSGWDTPEYNDETPEERAERHAIGKVKEWRKGEFDEGLIREQLTRNYNFLGEEAMAKVRNSYVVVVGCGGVGSWCALMLLRSGVGRLLLIDFDMTTLSSLNRHACATLEDVGSPKVIATQKFLRKIAPWAQIDVQVGLYRKGQSEQWLQGADWVVDAIDNIDTKVDLLTHCHEQDIKVFSSMGAGAKRDPTRVQIADISSTYEDPLARSVRRRLRVNGIVHGVPVVYSTEVPGEVKLLPLPEEEFQKGSVKELQAFDDFRVRILPVLGPLPAIFGLQIATSILLSLAGKPLPDTGMEIKNRRKQWTSLERSLALSEKRVTGSEFTPKLPITADDLGYIFEDLNHGRGSLPPHDVLVKPCAVRWEKEKPLGYDNVVIMNVKDAEKHEKECLGGNAKSVEEVWGAAAILAIQRRFEEARKVMVYRRV